MFVRPCHSQPAWYTEFLTAPTRLTMQTSLLSRHQLGRHHRRPHQDHLRGRRPPPPSRLRNWGHHARSNHRSRPSPRRSRPSIHRSRSRSCRHPSRCRRCSCLPHLRRLSFADDPRKGAEEQARFDIDPFIALDDDFWLSARDRPGVHHRARGRPAHSPRPPRRAAQCRRVPDKARPAPDSAARRCS